MKKLYVVWVKIDETVPWIELEGTYPTRREAKDAAKEILKRAKIKVVKTPQKRKLRKVKVQAAVTSPSM
ncbi:hypothetical protein DRO45_04425 [Candidatus Bathyarchaeota archaeon]|nr:MAG: hypothetical protein DRO45_04425 [Candidatus Bathyarchaeota archaeon]